MFDQPLGSDPRHHLVRVAHALPAIEPGARGALQIGLDPTVMSPAAKLILGSFPGGFPNKIGTVGF